MKQGFTATNKLNTFGASTGGGVSGVGMEISWQDGPLGRGHAREPPNGAFVEDVIAAAKQRLEYYQLTRFRRVESAVAITKLDEALMWLQRRTEEREERGVEGTHQR